MDRMIAWATAAWTGMGVLLWALFPMTAAGLLPMCSIAPLVCYWLQGGRWRYLPPSLPTIALGVAAAYLLVNATWSLSPADAALTVVLVVLMVVTLHAVPGTLPELEAPHVRAMAMGTLAGLAVGVSLLCFEVFSDQLLRRLLIRVFPALQPYPQHVGTAGGRLAWLAPYLTNANITVLALMFWPAALIVVRLGLLRSHAWLAAIAAAVVLATVYASEHATSQMALAGAAVAFALVRWRPRLALTLIAAGWVALILLVVPVASALYGADLHRASWLPYSARHRVVIWHYTSTQVREAPLLGTGIGTSRALREAADRKGETAPGTTFRLSPGSHSHNAYLQIWYETGAVGALIALALGLAVLRSLARFPADVHPYLAATFVTAALAVATAFSIWAPWFLASLAMAAVFATLGTVLPRREACLS
jgi:O-antigen ligase